MVLLTMEQAVSYGILEKVKEPEYQKYQYVNAAWVGKSVVNKSDGSTYMIIGVIPNTDERQQYVILPYNTHGLCSMYDTFTWSDGSPFGKAQNE
jgi:hypothetical protein